MAKTMHGLLLVLGAALIGAVAFFALYTFAVPRLGLAPAGLPSDIALVFGLTYGAVGGVIVAFGFIDAHVAPDEIGPKILPFALGLAVIALVAWILVMENRGLPLLRIQGIPIFTIAWAVAIGAILRHLRRD